MKKGLKILLHAIYWFYTFAWSEIIRGLFSNKEAHSIEYYFGPFSLSHYFLFPIIFYFNYFFIMPRFYKTDKIKQAWLGWVLLLGTFILLRYLIQEVLFLHWLGIQNYFEGTTISYYIFDNIYFGGTLIVMSFLFWIIDDNFKSQKEKMLLQEEKKSAQLAFLKNQVNPHFIFNTLNNIYSLVSSGSDKALPSIEKLSELMRYMYKGSEEEKVNLTDELAYINNFIELQKIRLSNKESIHYGLKGNTEDQKIAPLLLITFIENMFKHGVLNNLEKPLQIDISVYDKKLLLITSNYINTAQNDTSSGIGLENVKSRLEILYQNKHKFRIIEDEILYSCNLEINLA